MSNFSINEIIEMAAQIEKSGYAYYDRALQQGFLSTKGRELLTYLRDQEKEHEKFFNNMRSREEMNLILENSDWDTVSSYLRAIIEQRLFNDENSAIRLATAASTEKELLTNAIQFEKDTLLYFLSVRDSINDSKAKDILSKIIKEEVDHVLQLTMFRDNILK